MRPGLVDFRRRRSVTAAGRWSADVPRPAAPGRFTAQIHKHPAIAGCSLPQVISNQSAESSANDSQRPVDRRRHQSKRLFPYADWLNCDQAENKLVDLRIARCDCIHAKRARRSANDNWLGLHAVAAGIAFQVQPTAAAGDVPARVSVKLPWKIGRPSNVIRRHQAKAPTDASRPD
jgi:hypothetical protein